MADDSVLASTAQGAVAGGASGSVVPGYGTAIGAGVGALGGLIGGITGSNAASSAANAQRDAAQQWQDYVQGQESQAFGLLSTPSSMAAFDQALRAQESVVNQQQTLAQTLNPNLIDIGKQLHGLLNGQSAPILQNLQQQRTLQRQKLVDQLNTQMGPGGQSSTAGIQALNQFDQDTSNQLASAQNQYTSQFMNASLQAPEVQAALGQSNLQLGQLNEMSPDAQKARLMAQFTGAMAPAEAAKINSAGGQYLGQAMTGQMIAGLGKNLGTLAGAMYGANYNNPSTTKTPSGAPGSSSLTMPELGSQFGGSANYSLGANMNPQSMGMTAAPASYTPASNPNSGTASFALPRATDLGRRGLFLADINRDYQSNPSGFLNAGGF